MPFLMNAWYCAGWSEELGPRDLIGRKLLGLPVLLYRTSDGTAVAIGNRCPHRFAPLHLGEHRGDDVACPYHGLVFGAAGQCTSNPHGAIPPAATVPSYPLVERWSALWIWMGDQEADPGSIPDFSMTEARDGWAAVYGHHEVAAHYELVVDNLLDRSHVQYLHPLLRHMGPLPEGYEDVNTTRQVGDVVWDYHSQFNAPHYPLLKAIWPDAPPVIENYFDVRWEAPCNMLLDSGTVEMNTERKVGAHLPMANLITPADETSTHYFWNMARDKQVDQPEISEKIKAGVSATFKNEDGAMVTAVQELMGTTDLLSLDPISLRGDAAALRARRVLAARIAAEAAARDDT